MSDHILKLTVIDAGRTKRKAEIGHITYPLKELEIGDGSEQQLFKMDLEKVSELSERFPLKRAIAISENRNGAFGVSGFIAIGKLTPWEYTHLYNGTIAVRRVS